MTSFDREYIVYKATQAAQKTNARLPFYDLMDTLKRYSEPQRSYHGLDHIVTLLRKGEEWGVSPLVDLAIVFHDVIYVPGNKENEAMSAEYAVRVTNIEDLRPLIMATLHLDKATTRDGQLLQDLDLHTLGAASRESYIEINERVKDEFRVFPDWEWTQGRRAWLQSMLNKDEIFYTEFGKKCETFARDNLTFELSREIR